MASYTQQDNPQGPVASNSLKPLVAYTRSTLIIADKLHDILRVRADGNMIRDTSDERLRSLKEDLQRARAEQERHRTLRKAETDAERQARQEAAKGRHEDTMSQLRAMRELLQEQRVTIAIGRRAHEVVDMAVPRRDVPAIERRVVDALQPLESALGGNRQIALVEFARDERDRDAQVLGANVTRRLGGSIASQVFRRAVVELGRGAAFDDLR